MWWRKKKDEELNMHIEQLQMLKKANLELRKIYSETGKLPIAKDLIKIIKASDKIFDELAEKLNGEEEINETIINVI